MRQYANAYYHISITVTYRKALCGSTVVQCVEGEEAVLSRMDSDDDEDDRDDGCVSSGLICGVVGESAPEDWN